MEQKFFHQEDIAAFAIMSGDFNPLHTNSLLARRLMIGSQVVHGINLLLWALDVCISRPCRLNTLNVSFLSPVGVGAFVTCEISQYDNDTIKINLYDRDQKKTEILATYTNDQIAEQHRVLTGSVVPKRPDHGECHEMKAADLPHATGILDILMDQNDIVAAFPRLAAFLPPKQLAVLLSSTRLVGMECPGLHSLYEGINLTFGSIDNAAPPQLKWQVQRFDRRFSHVLMVISAPETTGTITAFLRPPPQEQPRFADMRDYVRPDVFAGRRAMVVGGSRGLGEVCAKLLAAGGGDVCLTYHRGSVDAGTVASDINDGGGRARVLEMDVLNLTKDVLRNRIDPDWKPTHLYYFPTPPITVAGTKDFAADIFNTFCSYYVTGFFNTVVAIKALADGPLSVFYPSSVFVDEIPNNMGEYAVAKAAGESMCRYLSTSDPTLLVYSERLPRLPTDQTVSIFPLKTENPITVILSILEKL